jgi:hypothetical protein
MPGTESVGDGSSEDIVDRLVLEALDLIEGGGQAAADELLRAHPREAAAIRERLDQLARTGLLVAPGTVPPAHPERIGPFRILERLGGGGMGVVYLAEDESLHRRIALKLIHPEYVHVRQAHERFRREVEAVARLQHPSIVPVYSVGEERGIPYFAMEWVDGLSLADVLRQLKGRSLESLQGLDLARLLARREGRSRGSRSSLPRQLGADLSPHRQAR